MRRSISRPAIEQPHSSRPLRDPLSGSARLPKPWCWVAEACIDSEGTEAAAQTPEALRVFAVSVHEQYPTDERQRLLLLQEVAQRLGSRAPPGCDSLWVYPAGYFGFDAAAFRDGSVEAWPGFDVNVVRERLPTVLRGYPSLARLAVGADDQAQRLWVSWLDASGSLQLQTITRHHCKLPDRVMAIGPIRAAFFVCGEFTGSCTEANGPYWGNEYLCDPAVQLADCRLLVDLAHSRVKGGVYRPPGPRLVHHRQMLRFAARGTAILTHHHPGCQSAGRARDDCQSNWVIFRGGMRLDNSRVHVIP
jgi:hypothetical protein